MTDVISPRKHPSRLAVLLLAAALSSPLLAADLVVTRYFSGLWDQPKQEHQGIVLQIVESDPDMKRAVGYWFTYGEDFESAWYIGIGHVEGPRVLLDMYVVSGVGFMVDAMPDVDPVDSVGSMVLSFRNCILGPRCAGLVHHPPLRAVLAQGRAGDHLHGCPRTRSAAGKVRQRLP